MFVYIFSFIAVIILLVLFYFILVAKRKYNSTHLALIAEMKRFFITTETLNLIRKMQRDIQPFTYDLYVSFFMRPKLVDKDGKECKVDFVYCDTDSAIKDVYFVRKCDRARLKADDIFIVIPTKDELELAEKKAEEREKSKKKINDYGL